MFYFLLGILVTVLFYYKLVKPSNYWQEKGVVHVKSWPIVGSMGASIFKKTHFSDIFQNMYNAYSNERYVGFTMFVNPAILIRDLDLIKQIGVKDFDHFTDHLGVVSFDSDPIVSRTLFAMKGNEWRHMRATLSPVFTSSKMKMMFELIEECAENFAKHFEGKRTEVVEMKNIFSKFTNDVIASTSFGIKTDSLNEPENEFFVMGKSLQEMTFLRKLTTFFISMAPKLALFLKIRFFPKKTVDFFGSIVLETIANREASGIVRPDLIHLLIEAKKGKLRHEDAKQENETGFATAEESEIGKDKKLVISKLSDDEIVAQALLFFFAGLDTTSTVSCFLAHELALNLEVQKKLQEEIDEVASKGKLTYYALLSMKYFDQVICEILRLWPIGYQSDRLCVKDYVIPPKILGEKSLVIEKGVSAVIPIMAIHRDPQYYPEPQRFDPERFNDENKSKLVSGAYMPFGVGPRNCIGSRFALLEVKALFFHLLRKFHIVAVVKTQTRLKFTSKELNLNPDDGFWLGFKPRETGR